jgi:hypothetical protein
MRSLLLGFGLSLAIVSAIGAGCAASDSSGTSGSGGASGGAAGSDGSAATGGLVSGGTDGGGTGGFDPDASCTLFTAEAKQASAAMLFVVDGSASMAESQKWGTAQLATVIAIDKDAFDNMTLGLVRFPASFVTPPPCLCDPSICSLFLPNGVACGVSFLPQVQLADSGTDKSNQGGVRKGIYDYLVANGPVQDPSDASPIYDALVAGYAALDAQTVDRRILVLLTDGGFSCTSLSNPQRSGYFDGACYDWEFPDTVNALLKQHHDDATKPTFTFVVGVPGSDSTGQPQGSYATAPYNMLLALSTYAVSGAHEYVPAGCDASAAFSQTGPAPAAPCHFDMSKTANFDVDKLAGAIAQIRGKALGCLYDLPPPPSSGQTIDKNTVNVVVTIDGTQTQIPQRSDKADPCDTDYCWDYKGDQVEILGKACNDLGAAKIAKVEIFVGCATVIK